MCFRLVQFALNRKSTAVRSTGNIGTFMGYDLDGTAINLNQVPQEYVERAFREMAERETVDV